MQHAEITSKTAEQTMQIAEAIGKKLQGGEVIELIADIGGGKTTFVRGLAKGAGSKNHVSSPTFTISKVYKTLKFDIVHFDFYRLEDAGLIEYEIEEAIFDPKSVIVIEWSDVVKHVLPSDRLVIQLITADDGSGRRLKLSYPSTYAYLVERLVLV